MEWNKNAIYKLIAEYKERPELWDSNIPSYSDRYIREKSLNDIAKIFDTDVEIVKKKINNLRTQFLDNQKKVIKSRTSGAGIGDVFEPKWVYYKEMMFLRPSTIPCDSRNNLKQKQKEMEKTFEDYSTDEDPYLNTLNSTSTTPIHQRKRKCTQESDLMAAAINSVARKDDLDCFGSYIAAELRTLSPRSRTVAKSRIFNTLMELKKD
ncbi:uncharacterized protein [Parasteatoda tepidariorum]|uniref:uncharacterized protein n=1 Tax=Parasteatoda tepidariorum TaxID=114398 RepID=UPI00077F8AAA|nr:uncharacterized protein LOC107437674 isoform X2 [Parasteatoda tepidariorum]